MHLSGRYYDLFLENYLVLAKDKGWRPPLLGGCKLVQISMYYESKVLLYVLLQ